MTVVFLFFFPLLSLLPPQLQPSYFYLEDYLPQTLRSLVYILFSFFDISEKEPSPKGEFSKPETQALIMVTTQK